MIDKSGKHASTRYYEHNQWHAGHMPTSDYSYSRDCNRLVRILAVIFMAMVLSALFNLDYANWVITAIDWLVSLWGVI